MMKRQNVRTLALIVCTFTYLLSGAAIFDALESNNETELTMAYTEDLNRIRYRYNISSTDMDKLHHVITKYKPYTAGKQWKFAGAFYFSLSVITTIGYGHIAPRTEEGRIFCILYALIGIPLNIVMFQSIGERFNIGVTILIQKLKKAFSIKETNATHAELTIVACVLCSAVLVGGAFAFTHFEQWSFVDSFYYCFITMSTIGFGDYVALQNKSMRALHNKPEYVSFSILYIIFGLTVFAAALNLMVLRLLTMNTEDERKDELQAREAARSAVRLDGDVITPGTQSTTVNSLVRDVEGPQMEVDDSSNNSHIYYPQRLKSHENYNNKIMNHIQKKDNSKRSSATLGFYLPNDGVNDNGSDDLEFCTSPTRTGLARHNYNAHNHYPPTVNHRSPTASPNESLGDMETVIASFPTQIANHRPPDLTPYTINDSFIDTDLFPPYNNDRKRCSV